MSGQSHSRLVEDTALLSVNGNLHNMYFDATTKQERSAGYTAVEIGKLIMIRYLRFYLKHQDLKNKNQLMISTFLNSQEQKNAAAEAINYFDNEAHSQGGVLTIRDFGGREVRPPIDLLFEIILGRITLFHDQDNGD